MIILSSNLSFAFCVSTEFILLNLGLERIFSFVDATICSMGRTISSFSFLFKQFHFSSSDLGTLVPLYPARYLNHDVVLVLVLAKFSWKLFWSTKARVEAKRLKGS